MFKFNMRSYPAREKYKSAVVAEKYDIRRFTSLRGRIAHKTEYNALRQFADKYFVKPGLVLDLPCGTGRLLHVFYNSFHKVVGGDISFNMLRIAYERFHKCFESFFVNCDAEKLPFKDNSFHYGSSFRFMSHLPPDVRRNVLRELTRVVRDSLIINYHFASNSPLALFNRVFRPYSYPTYPVTIDDIYNDIKGLNLCLVEYKKLSWYERSSALVVFKRRK